MAFGLVEVIVLAVFLGVCLLVLYGAFTLLFHVKARGRNQNS
jgi:hypothetical protein